MARLTISPAVTSTNYPQVGNNRTLAELKAEIASYAGGENKSAQLSRAEQSLRRALRSMDVWYWKFNIVSEDHTLASPDSGDAEFTLSDQFRAPLRAQLVDSSSKTRDDLLWVPWEEWATFSPDQSTTSAVPLVYTIRNVHEVGRLTVDPPPATTMTWPTLRVFYHRRIVWPTTDTDQLQVPIDFEEAMFEFAVGHFLSQARSSKEGKEYVRDFFQPLMREVMADWRSYGEIPTWGA